mmetsp:Transcript_76602/g.232196  ORF Transcript_76602/g.232196 Transcript_76602/m.232196 type:complete len:312 (-) Transcript_76602:193-1128(-)
MPGADPRAHAGAGAADPEGRPRARGLPERAVPLVHRRHQRARGRAQAPRGAAAGRGHPRPRLRPHLQAEPAGAGRRHLRAGRGRRDAVPRLQGPDLRHLQDDAAEHPGLPLLGHHASRDPGPHDEVHAQRRADPGEEGRADVGGHPAVLRGHREGGVEARHALRPLRHPDDHPGSHLLQHQAEGGLADAEDARRKLHRGLDPRRHAAEGARRHHAAVSLRCQPCADLHRSLGSRVGCAAGVLGHLLRPAEQPRALHPPHRPFRAFRTQGCSHQLCEERRHPDSPRHRAVLLHSDRRDANERCRPHLSRRSG